MSTQSETATNGTRQRRTLDPRLVLLIVIIPAAIALACAMPAIIINIEEITRAFGITTIIIGAMITGLAWLILLVGYTDGDSPAIPETIKKALLTTGITGGAIALGATMVDLSQLATGAAAGLTAMGAINMISGTSAAALEGRNRAEKKDDSIIRLGQFTAAAGAVICSAGILLLCRHQFPL